MKRELRVEIANFCVAFHVEASGLTKRVFQFYKDFISSSDPVVHVDITVKRCVPPPEKYVLHYSKFWKMGEKDGEVFFYIRDLDSIIRFKHCHSVVDVVCSSSRRTGTLLTHLLGLILFSELLPLQENPGIMLHACGVTNKKDGFLFTGRTNSGKSTIAQLRGKRYLLHDDNLAIRKDSKGDFIMYRTPWHREVDGVLVDTSYITNLFFIRKALENIITPVQPVPAVIKLMPNCFVFYWDSQKKNSIAQFCSDFVENVACYDLDFVRDKSIWRKIDTLPRRQT